jgi:CHAT domain-containing protein
LPAWKLRSVHASFSRAIHTDSLIQHREHDLGSRPRLWWCPAGPSAELPLHAAGIYKGTRQDCLANYVVSSYTPTLSALINAQSAAARHRPQDEANVLLVSVPDAPDLPPLPNTRVEADRIRDIMLSGHQTSIENVLKALPNASVLHLACHGHQSQDDTLTSGFSLHDGRLTLKRLMELDLPRAELAYLSACETASTDEYQPDEAINLAATMLFVGFKSVIATMWCVPCKDELAMTLSFTTRSMNDVDGPFVAERVYRAIFRDGKLDLNAVPYALDGAVRALRESGAHPSRWATYVHIGA